MEEERKRAGIDSGTQALLKRRPIRLCEGGEGLRGYVTNQRSEPVGAEAWFRSRGVSHTRFTRCGWLLCLEWGPQEATMAVHAWYMQRPGGVHVIVILYCASRQVFLLSL